MSSRPALGSTQPPIQWVPEALSLGVKQLGREADHSPPASAEVKKMWVYTAFVFTMWKPKFYLYSVNYFLAKAFFLANLQ
jgi:hypothetical protein